MKIIIVFCVLIIFAGYTTAESINHILNPSPRLDIGPQVPLEPGVYQYLVMSAYTTKKTVNENALFLSILSWIAVSALLYRNNIKKILLTNGFDHNIFDIMLKMRGGNTRMKILQKITYPKNRKQIAEEMGMDWKAVDRHINTMLRLQLVNEMVQLGNATFYIRNEKGTKLLKTLEQHNDENNLN